MERGLLGATEACHLVIDLTARMRDNGILEKSCRAGLCTGTSRGSQEKLRKWLFQGVTPSPPALV